MSNKHLVFFSSKAYSGICSSFAVCLLCAFMSTFSLSALARQCEDSQTCIEQNKWEFGIAMGAGVRSNPLVDGDNIPLILLIDAAWYSENVYFDNTELGYRWSLSEKLEINSYLKFDEERAYFHFFDPENILLSDTGLGEPVIPDSSDEEPSLSLSIDDIASRRWALLFGSKLQYYGNTYRLSMSIETDVSGVHKGQRLGLSYQKFWGTNNWQLSLSPSLIYKSDNLINYYYGVSERDTANDSYYYSAKGGIQAKIALQYSYKLSDKWRALARASYQTLHSSMKNSPLVEEANVSSIFIGAGYRF